MDRPGGDPRFGRPGPGWLRIGAGVGAQTILLAMLGVGLLVVIFRIARSLVARMIAVILAALISAVLRVYGPDLLGHLSSLLP